MQEGIIGEKDRIKKRYRPYGGVSLNTDYLSTSPKP